MSAGAASCAGAATAAAAAALAPSLGCARFLRRGGQATPPAREVATACEVCPNKCAVLAVVEGGRIRKLNPNPASPKSRGMLCARGNAAVKSVYDPDRVKQPLIRAGARGEGKWRAASWDEAFDFTAERLQAIKDAARARGGDLLLDRGLPGGVLPQLRPRLRLAQHPPPPDALPGLGQPRLLDDLRHRAVVRPAQRRLRDHVGRQPLRVDHHPRHHGPGRVDHEPQGEAGLPRPPVHGHRRQGGRVVPDPPRHRPRVHPRAAPRDRRRGALRPGVRRHPLPRLRGAARPRRAATRRSGPSGETEIPAARHRPHRPRARRRRAPRAVLRGPPLLVVLQRLPDAAGAGDPQRRHRQLGPRGRASCPTPRSPSASCCSCPGTTRWRRGSTRSTPASRSPPRATACSCRRARTCSPERPTRSRAGWSTSRTP